MVASMSHDELQDKLRKAMGKIPMAARDRWAEFLRSKGTEFTLRYEWIADNRFYRWVYECEEIDFGEGAETITVWICGFGRIGHQK